MNKKILGLFMIGCLGSNVVALTDAEKSAKKQTVTDQQKKRATKQAVKTGAKQEEFKDSMYVELKRSHLLGQTDGEVFATIFIPDDIASVLAPIVLEQQDSRIPELVNSLKKKGADAKTCRKTAEYLEKFLNDIDNAIKGLKSKFRLSKRLTGKGNKVECVLRGKGDLFYKIVGGHADHTNNATKETQILEDLQKKLQPVLKEIQEKAKQTKSATKKKIEKKPVAKKKITKKSVKKANVDE